MRSIVDRNVVMRRMTVFLISALNDSGHCALLHYTISCATVLYCTTQSPVPLCCTVLHNLLCHYSTVHNLLCHCVLLYYTISCATTLLCTISCATVLYCTTQSPVPLLYCAQSPVPLCSTVLHSLLCHCALLYYTISCATVLYCAQSPVNPSHPLRTIYTPTHLLHRTVHYSSSPPVPPATKRHIRNYAKSYLNQVHYSMALRGDWVGQRQVMWRSGGGYSCIIGWTDTGKGK